MKLGSLVKKHFNIWGVYVLDYVLEYKKNLRGMVG